MYSIFIKGDFKVFKYLLKHPFKDEKESQHTDLTVLVIHFQ
jgi:hypothetical protein